jgi:hypothetical protein
MKTEELLTTTNQLKKEFDELVRSYVSKCLHIGRLERENSALKQRIMDLEDVIEESKVVSRWQYVDGEMRKTK